MYILEVLDLSYHRSYRRVPHHLKHVSSQGCWMILIGYRTDGYWKAGGCFFSSFWYSKNGICDAFCDAFATISTRPTLPTLMTLTMTPYSRWTQMYHYLVALVSVYLTMDTFRPTLLSVDCFIGFWTEQPGDGDAFWQTHIYGWKKCQLTHLLITWPIYQWRRGYAYWRKQIEGDRDGSCLFQIPYINICLSIDWSISWSIYQRTDKMDGGTHQ